MSLPAEKYDRNKKDKLANEVEGLSKLIYNKIAPHSPELERAVVGILMNEKDAIYKVIDILQPDDFYMPSYAFIYTAILKLYDKAHQAEYVLVAEELKTMGVLEEVGGLYGLVQCTNDVVSSANLEAHCRIIQQKSLRRKTINLCAETINRMYKDDEDVFDTLEAHNDKLFINTSGILISRNLSMVDIGIEWYKEVEASWNSGGLTGIPTGIPKIDRITGGLQPGTLTVLAARTRHGKSALAAAMMHHCSSKKNPDYPATSKHKSLFPAAFMSLEMKNTELFARLVSAELTEMGHPIAYSRFKAGKAADEYDISKLQESDFILIQQAVQRLADKGMYIDDSGELTQNTLKAKIMKMILLYGVKIVFIDYAQLMNNSSATKNTNGTESLATIAKQCKILAKFFNIPIVLLSQVDRDTEKKEPRPPVIADIKGSGALEESADYIILCWRPELWSDNPVNSETQVSERGILYVQLAKHKMGELAKARTPFSVATNSFGDMSIEDEEDTIQQYINNHPQTKF